MTTTLQNIRDLSLRRKIAAAVLALSLIGTGIASLASVQDTLVSTVNYSVAVVDLQGSHDGTTFTQSTTLNWQIEGGLEQNRLLHIRNSGTVAAATVSFAATGTGSTDLTNRLFHIFTVTSAADCPTTGSPGASGVILNPGPGTIGAATSSVSFSLAVAQTKMLCLSVGSGTAPAPASTATQTITFTGTSA